LRGWHNESYRHSLASRGIMTNPIFTRMNQDPEWQNKNNITVSSESDFEDKDIDLEKEIEITKRVRDNWVEMWKSGDPDLEWFKSTIEKEKVDYYMNQIEPPEINIMLHVSHEKFGEGRGYPGCIHVYWLPYTYIHRENILDELYGGTPFGNNTQLLAHEISHSFGSMTEYGDYWNEIVGIRTALDFGLVDQMLINEIEDYMMMAEKNKNTNRFKQGYHGLRYLYRTFGKDIMDKILVRSVGEENRVKKIKGILGVGG